MSRRENAIFTGLGAIFAITCTTAAHASVDLPATVAIAWKVVETSPSAEALEIKKNRPIDVAKAQAEGIVELQEPAVRGGRFSAIPAGTVFARSVIGAGVICEPGRRPGQDTIACLADTDADGRFDYFGRVQTKFIGYQTSMSIGFLVGPNGVGGWEQLQAPVAVNAVTTVPPAGEILLQLSLTSLKGGLISRGTLFSLCAERNEGKNIWGAPINVQYCAAELVFPEGQGQQALGFLPSGSLKLHSVNKTSASISLDSPTIGSLF